MRPILKVGGSGMGVATPGPHAESAPTATTPSAVARRPQAGAARVRPGVAIVIRELSFWPKHGSRHFALQSGS